MSPFFKKLYVGSVFALLYIPLLVLILYSFNAARFSLVWHGFSLKWYHELFQDTALWSAFFNSIVLGLSASLIATSLGLAVCLHFFLWRKKPVGFFHQLLILLIVIPDLVLGVSLLIFSNTIGLPLGFASLLVAHVTFCLPFVIITINSRIHSLDRNVYFSALDLGASKWLTLRKILLPLLMPAVLSAFLLCFTLSFDDVIISYFVSGPAYNILPLTIYSLVRTGVTPELNALCSITLIISMAVVVFAHRLSRRSI